MSDRSRDQYRDGHRKTDHGRPLRWTGQWHLIVDRQAEQLSTILLGQWWEEDDARAFAERLSVLHPEWMMTPVELEFKDFYLPPRIATKATQDVPTGDIL